ncbi:hypothetical protein NM688_g8368 [Phlebia brevispora]|uniref:Uncharacterized protein n=1 Tax=Phlebia brevispora TaxID=194682 RepID=A0ACC1RUM6_9APHY|nr:hypothetical protein NM688_g8368 [Phlebia brevispora]
MTSSLIGSIVERKPGSSSSPNVHPIANKTGFPPVQHRSKSAFARARDDQKKSSGSERLQRPPAIASSARLKSEVPSYEYDDAQSHPQSNLDGDWRRDIEEENKSRVASMTESEREEERREILERFGSGVGDILRKARAAREAAQGQNGRPSTPPHSERKPLRSALASRPTSPDLLSTSSTRPPSRNDKRIRFADVTPKDVHVYESAPPSPKRKPLALLSPTEADGPTISLGEWKGRGKDILLEASRSHGAAQTVEKESSQSRQHEVKEPLKDTGFTEGTPEDIRRRFFPNVAPHDPSLAWIEGPTPEPDDNISALRFDLSGVPIPPALSETLPTYLGLHHHAEGTHAGYTLDDIFLLSRSTVPAQRASMLEVLGRIARKLSNNVKNKPDGIPELRGQENDLRKRILAAGVEAMGQPGSLGAQAVEAMWVCIVAWDEELSDLEGVELKNASGDIYASLPFEFLLQNISDTFAAAHLPPESLLQLLAIVRRLAQESNQIAGNIVSTPELITRLVSLL